MKFKIISLGCKVNSYECSALASSFLSRGYFECDDNNPDVVVINTCSVTATADQKSRQHIRKMINNYPSAVVAVMGCYSQGNVEYISNEIKPHVLVGTSHRDEIIDLIEQYLKTKERIVKVDDNPRFFTYEELGVTSFSENVRAYLKIQDGCDNFCTYCLIPYRRGRSRSRSKDKVIEEAKYLINQGYSEIVLTGIHVGGYGHDLNDTSFSDLVKSLIELEGMKSLRISSIEESEIDDELIDMVIHSPVLAKHLHIPLQSGSATVLKRMNRKYTPEQFLNKLKILRTALPDIALTTDVIVGFPGESDEEFNETVEFIKKCDFNMLHVFPFSAREGTGAYLMKNQIDPKIKKQRVQVLLDLSKELWNKYVNKFVGKEIEVLIEKNDYENNCSYGHTNNYIDVKIDNKIIKPGEKVTVLLQKSMIIS
jgi:threonylcarbamoyladenosine tRNA methylthiotransferase MtaB